MDQELEFLTPDSTWGHLSSLVGRTGLREVPIVADLEGMVLIGSIKKEHLEGE